MSYRKVGSVDVYRYESPRTVYRYEPPRKRNWGALVLLVLVIGGIADCYEKESRRQQQNSLPSLTSPSVVSNPTSADAPRETHRTPNSAVFAKH